MFELSGMGDQIHAIKIIGVGGHGCRSVQHIEEKRIEHADLLYINSGMLPSYNSPYFDKTIQNHVLLNEGELFDDDDLVSALFMNAEMVIIIGDMGDFYAAHLCCELAQISRGMKILVATIARMPLPIEGEARVTFANKEKDLLGKYTDVIIPITIENISCNKRHHISFHEINRATDRAIFSAVKGVTYLFSRCGLINIGFSEVANVLSSMGDAVFATASAQVGGCVRGLVSSAFEYIQYQINDLNDLQGVLVIVAASEMPDINDYNAVCDIVQRNVSRNSTVLVNVIYDNLDGYMNVTIVAGRSECLACQDSAQNMLGDSSKDDLAGLPGSNNRLRDIQTLVAGSLQCTDFLDVPVFLRKASINKIKIL